MILYMMLTELSKHQESRLGSITWATLSIIMMSCNLMYIDSTTHTHGYDWLSKESDNSICSFLIIRL